MTFRTPREAVELANNTPYGLAASVWTENINLALDVAPKLKAGVVWVTCTNQFDAAPRFGGYREPGFGRGRRPEGKWAYPQPECAYPPPTLLTPPPPSDPRPPPPPNPTSSH